LFESVLSWFETATVSESLFTIDDDAVDNMIEYTILSGEKKSVPSITIPKLFKLVTRSVNNWQSKFIERCGKVNKSVTSNDDSQLTETKCYEFANISIVGNSFHLLIHRFLSTILQGKLLLHVHLYLFILLHLTNYLYFP
jgi:hypothetical protein